MKTRLGFVGLGVMGAPMAGHLLRAGHEVTVWNRTRGKAEPLAAQGASVASSLSELVQSAEVIMLCVGKSEDVRECVEAMAPSAKPGTCFVDHSTIAPKVAAELQSELKAKQLGFVDAPITGGSMGAAKGQLTIFCGGEEADVQTVLPYLSAYAKRAERVGGPGQGQMMKLANQIAVGGALLGLCETLAFAKRAGLDLALTRDMIGSGAGGSWAFENYGPKILSHDWTPGFSITNQRKDFSYCIEVARLIEANVPGTVLVDQLLAELDEAGQGALTTAALYEVLLGDLEA